MTSFNPFSPNATNPNTSKASNIFGLNNTNIKSTSSIFGNTGIGNGNLFPNINNQNNNNSLFGKSNQSNENNNKPFSLLLNNNQNQNNQNQNNNNTMFNLHGINNPQNQNNNFLNNNQNSNIMPQNQYLNLNNEKTKSDLVEYQIALLNIRKCYTIDTNENRFNMFKDYLYMPVPKGKSPNEYNQYNPYSDNEKTIINDYKIWEEASRNNKNPNEFFPVQINSVDTILNRNKYSEKGILQNIANTIDNEKTLEKLNKKIDDEMNSKISDLKNCYLKANELEIDLSSKIAQYSYLVGTAKENIINTQEIKNNIKKTNDNIDKNNMVEICEKIKKSSNENFVGQNQNYIKDMNKEKVNEMLDSLVEIKNMMNIIYNSNKKNLDLITGMQKEAEKIFK